MLEGLRLRLPHFRKLIWQHFQENLDTAICELGSFGKFPN